MGGKELWDACPGFTRGLGIAVVLGTILSLALPDIFQWLFALSINTCFYPPSHLFPAPFLWQIFTSQFFEDNLLKGVIVWPLLLSTSAELENGWGTWRFICFIMFVSFFSGVASIVIRVCHYAFTQDVEDFFAVYSGSCGLVVACLIAMRHHDPFKEHYLGYKVPRYLAVNFHLLFITFYTVLRVVHWKYFSDWVFVLPSMWASWFYIRYYMYQSALGQVGDASETWLFESLWPRWLRIIVSPLSHIMFSACTPCRKMWLVHTLNSIMYYKRINSILCLLL